MTARNYLSTTISSCTLNNFCHCLALIIKDFFSMLFSLIMWHLKGKKWFWRWHTAEPKGKKFGESFLLQISSISSCRINSFLQKGRYMPLLFSPCWWQSTTWWNPKIIFLDHAFHEKDQNDKGISNFSSLFLPAYSVIYVVAFHALTLLLTQIFAFENKCFFM